MIDESHTIYYLFYAIICFCACVAYVKKNSTEGMTITTKEFKQFQASFLNGFSLIFLCELIASASFFHTFLYLKLSLEQITKLYVTTVVSTTGFSILNEIIDLGPRRDKCMLSAVLYSFAMVSILFGGHFEMLLLGRVLYGAASALHHAAFDSYLIHQHATLGFPDDWLQQTFSFRTHSMAFIAAASGIIGQTAVFSGPTACIGLCSFLFGVVALHIYLAWDKDMNGPRFMLSGFTFNMSQISQAAKSNKQVVILLLISSLCEAGVTIFTFYWAPWMTSMAAEETHSVPYEIVFATFTTAAMVGNYLHQLYALQPGTDPALAMQGILSASAAAFFLGSVFQTPMMAFFISVIIQLCIGGYWQAIGHLRSRVLPSELRGTSLMFSRVGSAALAVATLTLIHHSPMLTLAACASMFSAAAYLQTLLPVLQSGLTDGRSDEERGSGGRGRLDSLTDNDSDDADN